ncbi:hypothetical protein [Pedobacter agri]|nr:hypothetical protein [Pedobacter agri]MDQ1142813.1 hypothetical protein [Pedobacter agri]
MVQLKVQSPAPKQKEERNKWNSVGKATGGFMPEIPLRAAAEP